MTQDLKDYIRICHKLVDVSDPSGNVKRKQIFDAASDLNIDSNVARSLVSDLTRVGHGTYNINSIMNEIAKSGDMEMDAGTQNIVDTTAIVRNVEDVFVPMKSKEFVEWGNFSDLEQIVKSGQFYPTFITGHSGNGKSLSVEQVCAKLQRMYIRVQITPETDEDDLIGGFRLVNGNTVFSEGPVIRAMRAGAILLLDEIDRSSNRLMCLQGVLEGKPVLIKKTGELVSPMPGFNVISTANTKGKGSDDGRYISATIIDDAFLERFSITMQQDFPKKSTEKKIVMNHMVKFNAVEEDFAEKLVLWAETIRKTFASGGVDELISTRRLCHIVQSFSIFADRKKAIKLCTDRYDEDSSSAFIQLWESIDAVSHEDDDIPNATVDVDDEIDAEEFTKKAQAYINGMLSKKSP